MPSQLGGFSRDAKTVKKIEAENRASGQRAKRRKDGEAPSGYEQAVWSLAIRFRRYALADRIELPDLPIIHDVLLELIERFGMKAKARAKKYHQEVYGCKGRFIPHDMAEHCWYHYPVGDPHKQEARSLSWEENIEVIMAEFWSRIWDEHALDHFRRHFAEYGQAAAEHWADLRSVKAIDAKRYAHERGTIPADSKEG